MTFRMTKSQRYLYSSKRVSTEFIASGNGRAMENMYYHYGSDLAKMVADELSISPLERSTLSHQKFDILEQCRQTIQTLTMEDRKSVV